MRLPWVNFLLILGSTLFCLLFLEIGLRIAGFNPFEDLLNGRELILRESQNPDMVYELTPNSAGYAWGTPVNINSYGFRDREYSPAKPVSIYRIGVIGDSITFGNHLPLAATYPKQLERQFKQNNAQTEVLNLGIGGYDTAQEVALLEQIAGQFDIDEVVVGYCMNDAGRVSVNLDYIRRASLYNSKLYNLRALQFIRMNLDRIDLKTRSLLGRWREKPADTTGSRFEGDAYVKERMRWINEYVGSNHGYHDVFSWYGDPRKVGNVVDSFEKLKTLSAAFGFRVSVVIIPFLDNVDAYEWAYEIVHHEAQRRGFNVIEVIAPFREVGVNDLTIAPHDTIHPNELGHRIIANSLFEFYKQDHGRSALPTTISSGQ
jgi:lysophospholipase L1-like esterase